MSDLRLRNFDGHSCKKHKRVTRIPNYVDFIVKGQFVLIKVIGLHIWTTAS